MVFHDNLNLFYLEYFLEEIISVEVNSSNHIVHAYNA